MERRIVKVVVFKGDGDNVPGNFAMAIAWFQEKLEGIPEGFRKLTKLEISAGQDYYDSVKSEVEIYYCRPETDNEMIQRLITEKFQQGAQESAEKAELSRLKAKYEKG